jgi:DNA-directed RNA polymerase subunit K/omega
VDYTRFEKARIVGSRALQLSMGAPPLIETPAGMRDPVQVALFEFAADAIPLTVQRNVAMKVKPN